MNAFSNTELRRFNDDGFINVQDLVLLINMILGGRTIQIEDNIGANAIIYENGTAVFVSSDGNIAGIQMMVEASNLFINKQPFFYTPRLCIKWSTF